ncbi:cystatin-B-like [Onychostoma macrolepis]|uniref:Uncharacterized protein n=1 Tax=Onychostoma macrolepis TaxID=369639 RepID=A0A7J6D780_9TELE|nr:cystatin-B-like [Onychostoma macrolepis]KAF4115110.1 hypothetical protein G5714_002599 [Onychostoma macrolepis]
MSCDFGSINSKGESLLGVRLTDNLLVRHPSFDQQHIAAMSLPWKETEKSTRDVQRFCDKVRPDLEKRIGPKSVFTTLNFRAADTEIQYIAKVHVGENDCAHVKISQTLPCYGGEVKMLDFQFPKKREDEIEPF